MKISNQLLSLLALGVTVIRPCVTRGIAVSIVLCSLATACTTPYSTPQLSVAWPVNGDTKFKGLLGLATPDEKIVWTHGVCPTGEPWIQHRSDLVQAALGPGTTVSDNGFKSYPMGGASLLVDNRVFHLADNNGPHNLSIYFIVWSNATNDNRNALYYDWNNKYTHASLNLTLKQFFDDCLVDAIAYDGAKGEVIRAAMQLALRDVANDRVGGNDSDGFSVVTESLGSKIMLDSIVELGKQLPFSIAKANTFFMIANQIPLEDQASDTNFGGALRRGGAQKSDLPPAEGATLHRTLKLMRNIRSEYYHNIPTSHGASRQDDIITLVAFSDPNDLLSQDLDYNFVSDDATHIINVTVSNADTYLGYLELPNLAHCGYGGNQKVINMVVTGNPNVGQPVPNGDLNLACGASDAR